MVPNPSLTREIQALQKQAAALLKRAFEDDAKREAKPKPEPKAPMGRQRGYQRRSRETIEDIVRLQLSNSLPGAVVSVYKGQTVIEADGQRFKLLIQGPFERIRATTGSGVRGNGRR